MTKEIQPRMSARGYATAFLKTKSAKKRAEIMAACEDHVAAGASKKISNTLSAMRDGNIASLECRVSGDWSSYKRPAKAEAKTSPKAKAKAQPKADPLQAIAEKIAGDEELFTAFFSMVAEARK
jgi:hypothetical protein